LVSAAIVVVVVVVAAIVVVVGGLAGGPVVEVATRTAVGAIWGDAVAKVDGTG